MKTELNPKIFLVGGAVRDIILGNTPKDFDYVVVGATPEWMLERGYKQVGAAFPVFLHPDSGSEYALARRERKVAPGYHGFEVEFSKDVSLEEDLSRRDLTINSIAMSSDNEIIDPFNGREDLKNGIIRHTSEAFAEDPLRVMRVARFAARYSFLIHPDTENLCKKLVDAGELDHLSADRIWSELEKLFSEKRSSIGLKFLSKIGALHSVNRMRGLVKDEPEDFRHYDHDIEPTLSPMEKMFFGLNLSDLTNNELMEFRVPNDVVRNFKFNSAIHKLLMEKAFNEPNLNALIVKTFDTFREEIKNGKLNDTRLFFANTMKGTGDSVSSKKTLIKIDWAFKSLLDLDFTELVKVLKPSEIKEFVHQKKIDVVTKAMNDPQLELCPFCDEMPRGVGYDGQPAMKIYVFCNCGAKGPHVDYYMGMDTGKAISSAVENWNDRKDSTTPISIKTEDSMSVDEMFAHLEASDPRAAVATAVGTKWVAKIKKNLHKE